MYLRDASVGDSIRSGLSERGPTTDPAGFRINGIVGANIVDVDAPEGWIVEAVVLPDGRDILDTNFAFEPGKHYDGVRVILSDRVATIRGTLPAGYRLNPDSLWVVAFPEDEALRRVERNVKSFEVDAAGSFAIPDLRPGMSYLVSTCGWPCSSGYDAENLDCDGRNSNPHLHRPPRHLQRYSEAVSAAPMVSIAARTEAALKGCATRRDYGR